MTEPVNFKSGPDSMTAKLCHYAKPGSNGQSSYISFSGTGPRGGWVGGPTLDAKTLLAMDDLIADALGFPHRCKGCGRAEDDCSADPCEAVRADREA